MKQKPILLILCTLALGACAAPGLPPEATSQPAVQAVQAGTVASLAVGVVFPPELEDDAYAVQSVPSGTNWVTLTLANDGLLGEPLTVALRRPVNQKVATHTFEHLQPGDGYRLTSTAWHIPEGPSLTPADVISMVNGPQAANDGPAALATSNEVTQTTLDEDGLPVPQRDSYGRIRTRDTFSLLQGRNAQAVYMVISPLTIKVGS
jgi:hypothetical protein